MRLTQFERISLLNQIKFCIGSMEPHSQNLMYTQTQFILHLWQISLISLIRGWHLCLRDIFTKHVHSLGRSNYQQGHHKISLKAAKGIQPCSATRLACPINSFGSKHMKAINTPCRHMQPTQHTAPAASLTACECASDAAGAV